MMRILPKAMALAMALVLMWAGTALADNVQNDVVVGGNDTITAGGSTTINYRITANNGDGQAGCNAADASPATVTINAPAGVTATPSTRTFTSCGTNESVVFSSSAVGDHEITVSVSDAGTGTYNTNPAKFTLHVLAAADTTDPVVTVTPPSPDGNNGWFVTKPVIVDVSATDASGIASVNCTPAFTQTGSTATSKSGTVSASAEGITTVSCTATDGATPPNTSDPVTAEVKIDTVAPSISASLSPSAASTGWYNISTGAPTVSYTCSDATPGSGLAGACPAPHTFGEGANQSHSETVFDNAGNSKSAGVTDVDVDLTAPSISASLSPSAASTGWYNISTGAPTVSYTCSDATPGSGLAGACPGSHTFGEGEDQSHSATIFDNAGNSNSAGVTDVDVDLTAPGVTWNSAIADGDSYFFGSVPSPPPTCTATDSLSGPDTCNVTGYSVAVGSHTLSANALDKAGNSTVETRSYTVLAWTLKGFYAPVDKPDTRNITKNGSTVPLKFEVFAGATELTDTSVVNMFVTGMTCSGGTPTDAIEEYATGQTSLRYDASSGQFIFNWKSPKSPGTCWKVYMETDDGSSISANFMLK
jgi:hypothetical protein